MPSEQLGYTSSGQGTGFEGVGGLGSGLNANANNNMNPFAMLNNPDMLQNIMNNPMVTAMLSDTNMVREMLLSNPRMRQLVERNPELNHVLNNPEVMRQTIEMMRNPELMREMTRNTDRQLANIETHPEGFNLLSRLYHDLQDPLYDSMTQGGQQDPTSNTPLVDAQRNERNTNPLPNPWSSGGQGNAPFHRRAGEQTSKQHALTGSVDLLVHNYDQLLFVEPLLPSPRTRPKQLLCSSCSLITTNNYTHALVAEGR